MGLLYVEFGFAGLREFRAALALVDTGSLYCVLRLSRAVALGIPIMGKERLQLANGQIVEAPRGSVWVRYSRPDRRFLTAAAFMDTDEPVVGVEALEGLGLSVEPGTPHETRPRLGDTGKTPAQRLLRLTFPRKEK